jgi:hypothetical protein
MYASTKYQFVPPQAFDIFTFQGKIIKKFCLKPTGGLIHGREDIDDDSEVAQYAQ